jgi:serine/threonine protein kinase
MSAIPESDPREELTGILHNAYRGKYQNIAHHRDGGTSIAYTADYMLGDSKIEKRLIMVDRTERIPTTSERAQRMLDRGNATWRKIFISQYLPQAELNGVAGVLDHEDLRDFGWDGMSAVFKFIEGETLEERIHETPLTKRQVNKWGTDILASMQYMQGREVVHRDLKALNVIIDTTDKAWLIDLGNAKHESELDVRLQPTLGHNLSVSPKVVAGLTGTPVKEDWQTEAYSFGTMLYKMITGKDMLSHKDTSATRLDTGMSLLTEGRPDPSKHEEALQDAIATLPKEFKAYKSIIYKSMTQTNLAYHSLDEIMADMHKAGKPSLLEQIPSTLKKFIAAVGITAFTLPIFTSTGAYWGEDKPEKTSAPQIKSVDPYPLSAMWSGQTGEIINNIVKMDLRVNNITAHQKFFSNRKNMDYPEKMQKYEYPESAFVPVMPGDELSISVTAQELPRPESPEYESITMNGRVYIQGEKAETFTAAAAPADRSGLNNVPEAYFAYGYVNIVIPKDAKAGTSMLVAEFDAPKMKHVQTPAGKIISRLKVPLIVGDPEKAVYLSSVNLGFSSAAHYSSPLSISKNIDQSLQYSLEVPEVNYRENLTADCASNTCSPSFQLPRVKLSNGIAHFIAEKPGRATYHDFVPVQSQQIDSTYTTWQFQLPDSDFSERIRNIMQGYNQRSAPVKGLAAK